MGEFSIPFLIKNLYCDCILLVNKRRETLYVHTALFKHYIVGQIIKAPIYQA